ncbi:hypothetical protein M9R32_03145 [Paenisporosarcina quisquiliarum]|uniref:Uncharacterized protein n=1 Tax=Paenisporosarcina quisquiliarum TaxID=365346 RepID=A0A9X3RC00_9BACL|nr:hypothetical protein [Paenisporosarcina quisquiliarum]MCZ8536190.1 hypothetical protein [Paenisporosarcina quisquiliarum]
MNQVNWKLQEVFYFPESFGVPTNAARIEVKPQVEFQQVKGVCSLYGIYHISAHVGFQPGECAHHGTSEWVSIEDLDMNGENGYFEYAVPLFVELPPTYVHGNVEPEIHLSDVNAFVTDENALKVEWNVTCTYELPEPQESSSVEVITAPANSTSEESPEVKENVDLPFFLRDLKDAYSVYEVK